MAATTEPVFAKDDAVTFQPPPITGTILAKKYVEKDDTFIYLVEFTDPIDGEVHRRYFNAHQLTHKPQEAAA